MNAVAALVLLLLSSATVESCTTNNGGGWATSVLASSIDFKLHHKVVGNVLHMRLDAQHSSQRWLGFGFAEQTSGHMKGSDMVTASIDSSGTTIVEDRYATFAPSKYGTNSGKYEGLTAKIDSRQDYTVVCGKVESGRMEVYVKRPLDTKDKQDRVVGLGPQRIVWSYGTGSSVGYHGANRGAAMLTFIAGGTQRPWPSTDGSWVRKFSNYMIPAQTTTYACQSFSFPTDKDRHVVAIRPIINEATKAYPHHAILHVCQNNAYWNDHTSPNLCSHNAGGGSGGSSPLGLPSSQCSSLMWSWAVGLGDFILPSNAGFLVGNGASKLSHVILEIHYDNPAPHNTNAIDSSGFEAFYVETLRQHNAAGMTLGDPTASFSRSVTGWFLPYEVGALPLATERVHRQATCPSECTSDLSQEITVFSGLLHMHHFGEKIYTDLYDSAGSFVKTTNRIDFWDNGFQQMRDDDAFSYKIKPGDSLQTHCWFNTKGSGSNIKFGPATGDEMCMDFIFYYPAQYRGTDSNNNPLLFAFCGARIDRNSLKTVCGGMGQVAPGPFLTLSGQLSRGNITYADPLGFGQASPTDTGKAVLDETDAARPNEPSMYAFLLCVASLAHLHMLL